AHAGILARERRAGAHERAPPGGAVEVELLAPFLAPRGEAHGERGDELPEPLVARGELRERAPAGGREVGAEDRARGLVRGAQRHVAIDGEHPRREPPPDAGGPLPPGPDPPTD